MRRRIADHGITGARKLFFGIFSDVARQTRKDQIAIEWRRWALHHDLFHAFGHVAGQAPRTSLNKRFALRAIGRGERSYFELRMAFEQLNEALAHHASRAQNAHTTFLVYHL